MRRQQPFPSITWGTEFETDFDAFHQRLSSYKICETAGYPDTYQRFLFDAAFSTPGNGYIVELGTEYGHSACYLAGGSKAAGREQVITIDGDTGSDQSFCMNIAADGYWNFWDRTPMRQSRLQLNLLLAGVYDWVITMGCTSDDAYLLLDMPIRLLHVDAGHSYQNCLNDINKWQTKLIDGGLLICHDWDMPDVKRAVCDSVLVSGSFSDLQVVENAVYAYKCSSDI